MPAEGWDLGLLLFNPGLAAAQLLTAHGENPTAVGAALGQKQRWLHGDVAPPGFGAKDIRT